MFKYLPSRKLRFLL